MVLAIVSPSRVGCFGHVNLKTNGVGRGERGFGCLMCLSRLEWLGFGGGGVGCRVGGLDGL
jgi:hypothetical protein